MSVTASAPSLSQTITEEDWARASTSQRTFFAWLGYRPYLRAFIENPAYLRVEAIWSRSLPGFLPPDICSNPSEEDQLSFATTVNRSLSAAKGIGFSDQEIYHTLQVKKVVRIASVTLSAGQSYLVKAYLMPFELELDPKVERRKKNQQKIAETLSARYSTDPSVKELLERCKKLGRPQIIYLWLKEKLFKEYPDLPPDFLQDDEAMEAFIDRKASSFASIVKKVIDRGSLAQAHAVACQVSSAPSLAGRVTMPQAGGAPSETAQRVQNSVRQIFLHGMVFPE